MEVVMQKEMSVKQQLRDILLDISWAKIAQKYFGKSSSWLYHKMDGIDGNGGQGDFSADERMQLKDALLDLSDRVRLSAEKIIY
jgi:hypothetical protein